MSDTILTVRKATATAVHPHSGETVRLPIIKPIGPAIQDPDTPQREAAQYRAHHLAHEAYEHARQQQGTQDYILAIHNGIIVLVRSGWLYHDQIHPLPL